MKTTRAKKKTAKKKTGSKRKMAKPGRPKGTGSTTFVELGLRVSPTQAEIITRGAKLEAARLNIVESRNKFCLRAALAAAEKEFLLHPEEP